MANVSAEPFGHYIPRGSLNEAPGGGFQPPHVRREALTAILRGAEVGEHDGEYLDWLSALDDDTCRTLGSIMWRARLAGRAEIASTVANLCAYVDELIGTVTMPVLALVAIAEALVAVVAVWLLTAKVARGPHRPSPCMRPVRSAT
jgi:hypothetical protein